MNACKSYDGPLTVTVRTMHGQSVVVQTWGYRSVLQFKEMLGRVWDLYSEDIHLIYREQNLHNSQTLGTYMIEFASVTLVPRIASGFSY